jgi:NDP-sugar pyrophosphorylase family protein
VLTIVIPMAGRGSRFADAGYTTPKPLIPVHGVPMIELVVANLRPSVPARFVFLCQREHIEAYDLDTHLSAIAPGCAVVPVDGITEGAACTVLLAEGEIDPDAPLVIANSDQWVDADPDRPLHRLAAEGLDGLILTMTADDPKWSYVVLDDHDRERVVHVVEKEVVSDEATVGVYVFARGADYVRGAKAMIAADERVNGEFYVAPVYNRLLAEGAVVTYDNVGSEGAGMHGLGIPADLEAFLAHPASHRAVAAARPAQPAAA